LLAYTDKKRQALRSQYERDKDKRETKELFGAGGEKAREIYRILRKRWLSVLADFAD
jgi:hypothetical protein